MTTERAAPRADGHPTDQQRDGHATQQELLSGVALTAFRLNGQFLAVAEEMARPAGLTVGRAPATQAWIVATAKARGKGGRGDHESS